jgi:very-short-patch-repair endonuclease
MPKRNPILLERARAMRKDMSPVERHLWYALRDRRLAAVKFVRGTVIEPYIVDFLARTPQLILELDGDSHAGLEAYDARRTSFLEAKGYRVLRFTNADVMTNTEGVLLTIIDALSNCPSPRPSPQRGEGEA